MRNLFMERPEIELGKAKKYEIYISKFRCKFNFCINTGHHLHVLIESATAQNKD